MNSQFSASVSAAEKIRKRNVFAFWCFNLITLLLCMLIYHPGYPPFGLIFCLDGAFVLIMLLFFPPRNEFIGALVFLISYYAYVLGFSHLVGLADYNEFTALRTLENLGMVVPEDLIRYQLIYGVFKCCLFAVLWVVLPEDTGIDWAKIRFGRNPLADNFVVALLLLGALLGTNFSSYGFFPQGVRFLTLILILFLLYNKVVRSVPKTKLLFLVILIFASFYLTRSRSIVAIILLYYLAHLWRRGTIALQAGDYRKGNLERVKALVIALFAFVSVALYGVFRTEGIENVNFSQALLHGSKLESQGESGLMFLFSAHISSLRDSHLFVAELSDGLLDKIWRAIPLVPWKGTMLADRYVQFYFSSVADQGGGWAFSSLAEWYLYGGWAAVALYGVLVGLVIAWLSLKSVEFDWRILMLMFLSIFQRSETARAGYLVLYIAVWIALLRIGRLVVSSKERY